MRSPWTKIRTENRSLYLPFETAIVSTQTSLSPMSNTQFLIEDILRSAFCQTLNPSSHAYRCCVRSWILVEDPERIAHSARYGEFSASSLHDIVRDTILSPEKRKRSV